MRRVLTRMPNKCHAASWMPGIAATAKIASRRRRRWRNVDGKQFRAMGDDRLQSSRIRFTQARHRLQNEASAQPMRHVTL